LKKKNQYRKCPQPARMRKLKTSRINGKSARNAKDPPPDEDKGRELQGKKGKG